MVVKKVIFFLITLITVQYLLCEETENSDVLVPRKMVVFFESTGSFSENEKRILPEAFLILLSANREITILEPFIKSIPRSEAEMNRLTTEKGGDCWTSVQVSAARDDIAITSSSYDITDKKYVFNKIKSTQDRSMRTLRRSFYRNILSEIGQYYVKRPAVIKIVEVEKIVYEEVIEFIDKKTKLKIEGLPETEIIGLENKDPLKINDSGSTEVEVDQYVTFQMHAYKAGYSPVVKTFFVGEDEVSLSLDQQPASNFAADVYSTIGTYFGAAFSYFVIPDSLFFQTMLTSYMFRWMPNTYYDEPTMVNYLYLNFGYYIGRADWPVRLYITHGAFARFMFMEEYGLRLDPLSPWGLNLINVAFEFPIQDKIKFIFSYGPKLYFTDFVDQFKATASMTTENMGGYAFYNGAVLDFTEALFGVRFLF